PFRERRLPQASASPPSCLAYTYSEKRPEWITPSGHLSHIGPAEGMRNPQCVLQRQVSPLEPQRQAGTLPDQDIAGEAARHAREREDVPRAGDPDSLASADVHERRAGAADDELLVDPLVGGAELAELRRLAVEAEEQRDEAAA